MKKMSFLCIFILLLHGGVAPVVAAAEIQEYFTLLRDWEPITFPKIKSHSKYSILAENGGSVLKATSENSASGLVYRYSFNVYETPILKFRWKVSKFPNTTNLTEKKGDDYPIRIYVVFPYHPETASVAEKITYEAAKVFYGKYPPHSTLNYVWTGANVKNTYIQSPYTEKAYMVVLRQGGNTVGEWITETVNIVEDYRKAFQKNPPAIAKLAIMSDTDNTGTSAEAYIDFIEVRKKQ